VTGGGLPAEIWRETMLRLEDGMPVRPLPEVVPSPPAVMVELPNPSEVVENVGDAVQSVFRDVLGGLFGRN
jgi:hypothetical protein